MIAIRGGNSNNGARCPGALNVNNDPGNANWNIGARAELAVVDAGPLRGLRPSRANAGDVPCRAAISGRQKTKHARQGEG
jgi:hypothetical protein